MSRITEHELLDFFSTPDVRVPQRIANLKADIRNQERVGGDAKSMMRTLDVFTRLSDPICRQFHYNGLINSFRGEIRSVFEMTCNFKRLGIRPHFALTQDEGFVHGVHIDFNANYDRATDEMDNWFDQLGIVRSYVLKLLDAFVWCKLIVDGDHAIGARVLRMLV